jgi:hypothetical protein
LFMLGYDFGLTRNSPVLNACGALI